MQLTQYNVLRLLCCLLVLHAVEGQNYDDVSSLKTSLLTKYDTTMIPRNNLSDVVDVTISVNFFTIFDVDVVHGMLTTLAKVYATWTDDRITWNTSNYEGLSMLKFPRNTVWTPNIAIAKSLETKDIGEAWMTVQYQPNGMAYWDPGSTLKTACAFNVKFWPFDKHVCNVDFFLYGTNYTEALLTTKFPRATLRRFIPHSEWEVEGTFAINILLPESSVVNYGLKLRRHSTFYSLTIILPLIILNMFNCCVFLLPSDSGERISFSMTIMLSIVVFFLLIGDHVPKTSDPLPLICQFVGVIIGTACGSLVFTIFSLSLYFRKGTVPEKSWGRRFFRVAQYFLCQCTLVTDRNRVEDLQCVDHSTTMIQPFGKLDQHMGSDKTGDGNNGRLANKEVALEQNVKRPLPAFENENPVVTLEWSDVSQAMDKLLFIVFLVATLIPSIVFPVHLSSASAYPDL